MGPRAVSVKCKVLTSLSFPNLLERIFLVSEHYTTSLRDAMAQHLHTTNKCSTSLASLFFSSPLLSSPLFPPPLLPSRSPSLLSPLQEQRKGSNKTSTRGLDEDTVGRYAFQILKGLSPLHEHGYTHRNLSPGNILLDNEVSHW